MGAALISGLIALDGWQSRSPSNNAPVVYCGRGCASGGGLGNAVFYGAFALGGLIVGLLFVVDIWRGPRVGRKLGIDPDTTVEEDLAKWADEHPVEAQQYAADHPESRAPSPNDILPRA